METFELSPIENIFDALAVRKIRNECKDFMTNDPRNISLLKQFIWYLKTYRNENKKGNIICYLFKRNNKNLGYAFVKKSKNKYYITGGLRENERGKGYGRQLFKKIIAEVPGKEIYLEVLESNHVAKKLYKSLGFKEIEKKKKEILEMKLIKK